MKIEVLEVVSGIMKSNSSYGKYVIFANIAVPIGNGKTQTGINFWNKKDAIKWLEEHTTK